MFKKLIIASLLFFFTCIAFASAPRNDPAALMQYIANNMVAGLKANQATLKTRPDVVYRLAEQYIVPYADLADMAKHVLPPATWNSATPAQRAQFERAFERTLIRTYSSSLTSYSDQTVTVYPVRGGVSGNTVEVNSQINSSEGEPIQVTYTMVRVGGGWRLYDLSVEGVSMLESFRAQFSDLLSQGDMNQLLQRMSNHNED